MPHPGAASTDDSTGDQHPEWSLNVSDLVEVIVCVVSVSAQSPSLSGGVMVIESAETGRRATAVLPLAVVVADPHTSPVAERPDASVTEVEEHPIATVASVTSRPLG